MGHPEKVIDFAYRSDHEMTVTREGDRQRVLRQRAEVLVLERMLCWRAAGDEGSADVPGRLRRHHRRARPVSIGRVGRRRPSGSPRRCRTSRRASPRRRRRCCTRRSSHACDGLDGVKDGLIENPVACKFDPAVLVCKGGEEPACLTQAQVETARLIYSPIVDAKTKQEIPGLAYGSELGWTDMGWSASARATGLDQFRYLVFSDPQWDIQKFNVASDVARADREGRRAAPSTRPTPNLKPFFDRGRQADSVPRVERPADHAAGQHAVLQSCRGRERWRLEGACVLPFVHGARHGALRRR